MYSNLMGIEIRWPYSTPREQCQMLIDELLTIPTAARLLNIAPATVATYLSRGVLKRVKVGRRTMLTRSELERFVREGGVVSKERQP
jgi:excisionase family DNA binding protein